MISIRRFARSGRTDSEDKSSRVYGPLQRRVEDIVNNVMMSQSTGSQYVAVDKLQ